MSLILGFFLPFCSERFVVFRCSCDVMMMCRHMFLFLSLSLSLESLRLNDDEIFCLIHWTLIEAFLVFSSFCLFGLPFVLVCSWSACNDSTRDSPSVTLNLMMKSNLSADESLIYGYCCCSRLLHSLVIFLSFDVVDVSCSASCRLMFVTVFGVCCDDSVMILWYDVVVLLSLPTQIRM